MFRSSSLVPALAVLALAALLLGESFLPGRAFLPLLPGDFETWRALDADVPAPARHPHPNFSMSDVPHLLVVGLVVTGRALAEGHLPLWDPSQACGLPHLDMIHYGVLSPPAWLPLAFGWTGLALAACVHLLVAGLGMAAYLRALGRSTAACTLGALAFAGSAWITARLHAFPVVGSIVWLPLVLWGLERAAQGRARCALGASVALALSWLAGFPQLSLWVLVLAVTIELARAVVTRRCGREALLVLLRAAGALALGLALAAPQLLPTLDYAAHESARRPWTPAAVGAGGLQPALLLHFVVPQFYAAAGVPGLHPLALADLRAGAAPGALSLPEVSCSIGIAGLLLAALALICGRGWRTRLFGALALATLALLLWPAALTLAATLAPLLWEGGPLRLLALLSFALAVLAADGLDLLCGFAASRLAPGLWLALGALLLAGLAGRAIAGLPSADEPAQIDAWASALRDEQGHAGVPLKDVYALVPPESFRVAREAAHCTGATAVGAALVAALLFVPRRRAATGRAPTARAQSLATRWPLLVALLVLAESALEGFPLLRAAPASALAGPQLDGGFPEPRLATLARAAAPEGPVPARVARYGPHALHLRSNLPTLFGLADVQAYAPMAPRRVVELLTALEPTLETNGSTVWGFVTERALALPAVDLLGLTVLLTSETLTPPGFVEVASSGGVRVLRNTEVLPRLFALPRRAARRVDDPGERLALLADPGYDPRRRLLLSGVSAAEVAAAAAEGGAAVSAHETRTVDVVSYTPGRVRVRVGAGEPALLVFTETWHAGWRAAVEDRDVPIVQADHAFMALPVDATAACEVNLVFEPPLVRLGFGIGGGALALLSALRLRRRPPR